MSTEKTVSAGGASRRSLLLFACGAITACATPGSSTAGGQSGALAPQSDYRLGAGDQLRVIVFGETELTGQYIVSAQGKVSFPLVGEVDAAGKTSAELTAAIVELLQKGYIRRPNVAVEVLNYRPFYILGEVENPGTYPYSANLTVLNAVATAGGYKYRADKSRVFIRRADQTGEERVRLTPSTLVQPGDTLRIPERRF
jgi:polysaccharide biosynthesis/export protein